MEAKGRDYPSHGATIRKWFTDDRLAGKVPRPPHQPSYDIEAFEAGGFELPRPAGLAGGRENGGRVTASPRASAQSRYWIAEPRTPEPV